MYFQLWGNFVQFLSLWNLSKISRLIEIIFSSLGIEVSFEYLNIFCMYKCIIWTSWFHSCNPLVLSELASVKFHEWVSLCHTEVIQLVYAGLKYSHSLHFIQTASHMAAKQRLRKIRKSKKVTRWLKFVGTRT